MRGGRHHVAAGASSGPVWGDQRWEREIPTNSKLLSLCDVCASADYLPRRFKTPRSPGTHPRVRRAWAITQIRYCRAAIIRLVSYAVGNVGFRTVFRAVRATFRPVLRAGGPFRPVCAARATFRPVFRSARATFRPVFRTVRAVLRAVPRVVRAVVLLVAIVFLPIYFDISICLSECAFIE